MTEFGKVTVLVYMYQRSFFHKYFSSVSLSSCAVVWWYNKYVCWNVI